MGNKKFLKPCPFCSGNAKVHLDQRFILKPCDFPKWYIQCESCHVRMSIATVKYCVDSWNKRKKIQDDINMEDDGKWNSVLFKE